MPRSRLLPLLPLVALLAGCGTSGDRAQAQRTVERFYDAIRHHDGSAACDELSTIITDTLEFLPR